MSPHRLHPRSCERAREWVSLRLDAELSEFERVLLHSHLERCSGCAAYAETVSAATHALRRASLQRLPKPVTLPARRRVLPLRTYQAGVAAAVVAVAVGLGSLFGSLDGQAPAQNSNSGLATGVSDDALLRGPRLAMINAQKGVGKQRGIGIADV
jgi:predicted anti-sigma-YlaC factor YlaD